MKVELAFDIMQDGFLRVKGQVCEYDDRFGAEMVAQGHFMRHPDTPARVNSALYSLGCLPVAPPTGGEEEVKEMTDEFTENNPPAEKRKRWIG